MTGQARIGTSGFTYDHWREVFYPPEVKKRQWLEHYCRHFDTVEINSSYYHMPRGSVCESWRRRSGEGFRFVMKLNGSITHRRRLADCAEPLSMFLEAAGGLGEKLGPILVQLPPSFRCDPARLEAFLAICPPQRRWAVEFRHESWLCGPVYSVLSTHNAALVVHDIIQDHPHVVTADWTYYRFHGPGRRYAGCYTDTMLCAAAGHLAEHLAAGLDVYAYFNNDVGGHAVTNARRLIELVSA